MGQSVDRSNKIILSRISSFTFLYTLIRACVILFLFNLKSTPCFTHRIFLCHNGDCQERKFRKFWKFVAPWAPIARAFHRNSFFFQFTKSKEYLDENSGNTITTTRTIGLFPFYWFRVPPALSGESVTVLLFASHPHFVLSATRWSESRTGHIVVRAIIAHT